MSRDRSMHRLNMLALAAFLLGVSAFIYDNANPGPTRLVAELTGPAIAKASGVGALAAANPAS